ASQLLESIESETQAAANYVLNAEERGSQQRANYAAEAMELITEAMGLANDVGMPGVVDYLAAAATRLSQLHTIRTKGTNRRGTPLPTPNAFEIAALTVGVMEESSQPGEQPSMAEMLELLELVQAGMALLTRGRHSYNWQVTHWATDAAEEALALLSVATATDNPNELGGAPPQVGDILPRLRNLLDEAATGVGVLVGIYPHRGENEYIHPADTIAQNQHGPGQVLQHPRGDPPDALHVYKAQRALRQLHPFLEGEMRVLGDQALDQLGAWIQSHWGEAVQLLSSDEEAEAPPRQSREEEQTPERGRMQTATILDADSGAASSTAPFTRFTAPAREGSTEGEPQAAAARRRSFTSPSSLDNDD
ncbi:pol, partial [Symbiodinium necroappetens]